MKANHSGPSRLAGSGRLLVILMVGLTLSVSLPAEADSFAKLIGKAATTRLFKSPVAKSVQRPASRAMGNVNAPKAVRTPSVSSERAAHNRILRQLDNGARRKIEHRYGGYIAPDRLRAGRRTDTDFLDHGNYQRQLQRSYPGINPEQRRRVLGNYLDDQVYVDRNQVRVPRVTAHERLHQYSSPQFQEQAGSRLDEGLTEHFASRIYRGMHLNDLPPIYPQERRIAQMLEARTGEETMARAFFRGDTQALRQSIDAQVGRGAFDDVVRALEKRDYTQANHILRPR